MIIVRLIGGLGNQLFQYALGRKLATIHNVDLKLDVSHFETYKLRSFCLDQFNIINEHATPDDIRRMQASFQEQSNLSTPLPYCRRSYIKEQFYHFDPNILLAPSDAYLEGSWQSQKYFQDIADIIRHDFKIIGHLSEHDYRTAEKINNSNSIALHIRRGDYVTNKHTNSFHGVCSLGYYSEALKIISEHVEKPTIFIFSDDIDWVKANLQTSFPCNYVAHNSADKDYADLWLMSLCKHQIIANSTFSWWAAWLNKNYDKLVIAPKEWFATDTLNDKDLIPDTWLRISDPGANSIFDRERGKKMIGSEICPELLQGTVSTPTVIDLPGGAKALFSSKKTPDKKTVLLTTSSPPAQTPFSTAEKRPPIGIGYLIAVLREAGHGILFIDPYLQPVDYVNTGILQSLDIDFVGIYCNTICFRNTLDQVYQLEEQRIRGIWHGKIMAGGPHVSVRPETLPEFVDFLVQGEGEQAIVDIVEGKVHDRLVKYPPLRDLDVIPRPAWDFFVRLPYDWGGNWLPEAPVFTMNTSRGCPFSCTFCSVCSIWGKRYTYFSAERVVEDIEHLIRNFGARGIYFREDNFTLKRDRLVRFCNLMIERNIRIPWVCESRVSNLDRELVALMARAGAVGFYFGVESGSQRLLDFMKKGIRVEQIRSAFQWCHEFDIKTAASVIVGVPTETEEELRMTASLLEEVRPTVIWFNIFVGIPNSELFQYARDNNLIEFTDDRGLAYLKGHNTRVDRYYGKGWDAKIPVKMAEGTIADPRLSVIMSVYNGEKYLNKSIDSILAQSFLNYEFIIVDDASTDETPAILKSYQDPRIRIITNESNMGLTASLNRALRTARGEYVARMDADDLSLPGRFEKQISFLEGNPGHVLVGTQFYIIQQGSRFSYPKKMPETNEQLTAKLRDCNAFCHGSVMLRKNAFQAIQYYNEEFTYAQDYDAWLRISRIGKFANLKDPLYAWRDSSEGISNRKRQQQDFFALLAKKRFVMESLLENKKRSGEAWGDSTIQPSSGEKLSIIVTTYNRPDLLDRCLEGFAGQSLDRDRFEVIVIDDGSPEPAKGITEKYAGQINLTYRFQENAGLAAARNAGISLARNRIIVPYDDDNTPTRDCLEEHLRFHRDHPASEDAMLAFMAWDPKLEITPLMHYVTEVHPILWCYRNLAPGQLLRFGYLWGGCSSYKKSLIEKAGLFNPQFRFGYEDTEAELRMRRQGLRVHFHPQAKNLVLSPVTYTGFCRRLYRQGQSLYRFAALYPENETVRRYAAIDNPYEVVAEFERLIPELDRAILALLDRGWSLPERSADPSLPSRELLYQLFSFSFTYWKNKGITESAEILGNAGQSAASCL